MKKAVGTRRQDSLSRDRIIDAAIRILDSDGETGLTFQALAKTLATGAGAIYWHVENKNDLLTAACDAVVARTLDAAEGGAMPGATIRALAVGLFDAMDEHPWIGSALARAGGKMPILRILERLGQQVRALGVPQEAEWTTVSAILSYILGVGGQNAANAQFAGQHGLDRSKFLEEVADEWSRLDPDEFPFARSIALYLPQHDDRADFVAGIDLILRGIGMPS
jgi:AcrR family transcriptional regulator